MDILLAFLQLLTICIGVYIEYKKGSASIFLWATLLVMFGLPHLTAVVFGLYDYPTNVMNDASLFVILFNAIYLCTRLSLARRRDAAGDRFLVRFKDAGPYKDIASSKKSRTLIRILLLGLTSSVVMVVLVSIIQFGGILNSSWSAFYSIDKSPYNLDLNAGLVMNISRYLLFACGGVILPLLHYKKRKYALLAATLVTGYALITRNRITILPVFVALIVWYLSANPRIGAKQVAVFSVSAVLVVYSVYALHVFRHYGSIQDFLASYDFASFNRRILEMIVAGKGELGLRNVFYYFIYMGNRFPGFGEGRTYVRLLMILLPTRYSFGLKPPDFAITMGSAYLGDFTNTTYSTHPTLYGDCFANLSWCGVLLGVFWAHFVFLIDKMLAKRNPVIRDAQIVLLGCVYVIIGRGSVYNGCFLGLICWLFLVTLNVLVPSRLRQKVKLSVNQVLRSEASFHQE